MENIKQNQIRYLSYITIYLGVIRDIVSLLNLTLKILKNEIMKKSKLINYTTQDFVSEKELELKLFRWNNIKDKYLPKLKANGILRMVTTKVWNKEGVSRLGHLFEYEDDKAFQKCQPIFQEIERNEKEDQSIKVFGNRGVVLEEYDFRND